jgi:hypothetical protein
MRSKKRSINAEVDNEEYKKIHKQVVEYTTPIITVVKHFYYIVTSVRHFYYNVTPKAPPLR